MQINNITTLLVVVLATSIAVVLCDIPVPPDNPASCAECTFGNCALIKGQTVTELKLTKSDKAIKSYESGSIFADVYAGTPTDKNDAKRVTLKLNFNAGMNWTKLCFVVGLTDSKGPEKYAVYRGIAGGGECRKIFELDFAHIKSVRGWQISTAICPK